MNNVQLNSITANIKEKKLNISFYITLATDFFKGHSSVIIFKWNAMREDNLRLRRIL